MLYQKGQSGNSAGRPKGSQNRATGELREVISNALKKELTEKKIRTMLKDMKPRQRLNFLIKLTDFVLPRLKQQDIDLNFENLSDSTIDALINRLFDNNSQGGEIHNENNQ